jgi:hypothetical protein
MELKEIEKLVSDYKEIILQQLNRFYKGTPVKSIKK